MSETTKLTTDRIASIRQRDVFPSAAVGLAVPLSVTERDALCDAAARAETLEAQAADTSCWVPQALFDERTAERDALWTDRLESGLSGF